MSVLLSYRSGILVLVVTMFIVTTGCTGESHPLNPTFEELMQRGFYVYVLPKSEMEKRGWSQTVSIWSWDRHCTGVEPSETSNPIYVRYEGQQEQPGFALAIGPWDMTWDHREPTTEVEIDTQWAANGRAVYYIIEDYAHIRFEDRFGIPVQVGSRLPITEMVQLINQLEYVGPPSDAVGDPWDCSR